MIYVNKLIKKIEKYLKTFCFHNLDYLTLHHVKQINIYNMKTNEFRLELSLFELLMLEVELEARCQRLFDAGLGFDREKSLLEKIYEVSPSNVDGRLKL